MGITPTYLKRMHWIHIQRRLDLNLTKSRLARAIGVSTYSFKVWEADRFMPSIKMMPKIIEFLGYNPFDTTSLMSDAEKTKCAESDQIHTALLPYADVAKA
jgi:DNA-binding XRE family transcriptional regulator